MWGALGPRVATNHRPAAYVVSVLSAQELKLQMLCRIAVDYPPNLSRGLVGRLTETTRREDTFESLEGIYPEGNLPCSGQEEPRGAVLPHRRQWQHPGQGETGLT